MMVSKRHQTNTFPAYRPTLGEIEVITWADYNDDNVALSVTISGGDRDSRVIDISTTDALAIRDQISDLLDGPLAKLVRQAESKATRTTTTKGRK